MITGVAVFLEFDGGNIEQVFLDNGEGLAVLGFIKKMKEETGKGIQTISATSRNVKIRVICKSSYTKINDLMENAIRSSRDVL